MYGFAEAEPRSCQPSAFSRWLIAESRKLRPKAANIAEGCGRDGDAELGRFLQIAMGSASELEYTLLLAKELGQLNDAAHKPLAGQVTEVKRMLASLIGKLKADR